MLLPCASYGGYILGSDIDYRIIVDESKWKFSIYLKKKKNCWYQSVSLIFSLFFFSYTEKNSGAAAYVNFVQSNLTSKFLDTLLADHSHIPWRKGLKFDAIVTDRKKIL